jgi:hypothetical protein
MRHLKGLSVLLFCIFCISCTSPVDIYVFADTENDLCKQLTTENYNLHIYSSIDEMINNASNGSGVLILAANYPETTIQLDRGLLNKIEQKRLKCYAEFVSLLGDEKFSEKPVELLLERGVITSDELGEPLKKYALLGLNRSYVIPVKERESLMVAAKVVGFDKAEFGLKNTPVKPLLFIHSDYLMVGTSKLSNFATGRFSPEFMWKQLFQYVIGWITSSESLPEFKRWLTYVEPAYKEKEELPEDARENSIKKGIQWFHNGHFFLSEESFPVYKNYETSFPYGPGLAPETKDGNGRLGILEGHGSVIRYNGKQDYRYWRRNDVQGEVILAMTLVGNYFKDSSYKVVAKNMMEFAFDEYTQGVRRDMKNPNYGLMSWASLYPNIYYGDDNARALLGYILANQEIRNEVWDRKIAACILANYRTSSRQGYRGSTGMLQEDIEKNGWRHYFDADYVNPHPHFESWLWACYLWLYDKTGYTPLLEKTRMGIATTMDAYPDKWRWTNGIQQERGRMILPLAWLVRIEPSEQHLKWLNNIIDDLLVNQVACGAIREQMGDPSLNYVGEAKTNDDYGKYEAPLIFRNGDPVSDMLYTTNFAFFGLNEAVQLTKNPAHRQALERMSEFLIRIQISSDKFKDLDGAWFRAFNYKNWDYWANNADNGWGAWCTLTGWIQSWIISTQIFLEMKTTYWDMTRESKIGNSADGLVRIMF